METCGPNAICCLKAWMTTCRGHDFACGVGGQPEEDTDTCRWSSPRLSGRGRIRGAAREGAAGATRRPLKARAWVRGAALGVLTWDLYRACVSTAQGDLTRLDYVRCESKWRVGPTALLSTRVVSGACQVLTLRHCSLARTLHQHCFTLLYQRGQSASHDKT